MDQIKVLYVDDEVSNLNAFKASFRRQFQIYTATSADEGLEILKNEAIEIVLADQRMPGKTGVDFFESILDINPNPIRILLTAYSDINAIIDAINKGKIYRYITKPWNDFDLKLTIENAYQLYLLREQNNKLNLKYRRVFSETTDPIILFDTKGRIIDYNKATLSLVNETKGSLNFLSFNSIILNKSDTEHIIQEISKKRSLKDYECEIMAKDGEIKICLVSGNTITNNQGEVISYQAIIKDITERNKTNQLLLKKTIETQEEERERIARDLHDGIGQSLAAIKLQFESLKANYDASKNISKEIKVIPEILQEAIQELRRVCFNTLPIVLQEHGLIKAIEELKIVVSTQDFKINFNHNNNTLSIANSLEISIFRIIQEFINNSIKHSHATQVDIDLLNNADSVLLNIKDNGIGFIINDLDPTRGRGLKNIKNKVESFQGKINISSENNIGTEFEIAFPLHLN